MQDALQTVVYNVYASLSLYTKAQSMSASMEMLKQNTVGVRSRTGPREMLLSNTNSIAASAARECFCLCKNRGERMQYRLSHCLQVQLHMGSVHCFGKRRLWLCRQWQHNAVASVTMQLASSDQQRHAMRLSRQVSHVAIRPNFLVQTSQREC